jgi:hypothetical protein
MNIYNSIFLLLFFLCLIPGEENLKCPECTGQGVVVCKVKTCQNGKVICPNSCLKKENGPWVKMKVAGHGPEELWKRYNNPDGTWRAWTQAHIGEVIELKNGKHENSGKCSKCSGTTRVDCQKCKGEPVQCPLCKGAKVVTVQINEQFIKNKLDKQNKEYPPIMLKDGTVINGKISMRMGKKVVVKLPSGDVKELNSDDMVNEQDKP